jgi:hypothetical protein
LIPFQNDIHYLLYTRQWSCTGVLKGSDLWLRIFQCDNWYLKTRFPCNCIFLWRVLNSIETSYKSKSRDVD